eukprot:6204157-Pleurochrysis_carterae.AAC.6
MKTLKQQYLDSKGWSKRACDGVSKRAKVNNERVIRECIQERQRLGAKKTRRIGRWELHQAQGRDSAVWRHAQRRCEGVLRTRESSARTRRARFTCCPQAHRTRAQSRSERRSPDYARSTS